MQTHGQTITDLPTAASGVWSPSVMRTSPQLG